MVFEAVVTDVINKFLGDYVENLDKKQLKIGIWGGDVVLHNLKLRENALDDLDLPVQLIYGYLGKLVLKIPWKNLYGQPVIAQIEDLYALVSPKQEVQYNEEKEEKYELQTKQAALAAFEEANKKKLAKDQPKPDATFAEKLTAQIVNNLQIKISNVHLRYEDSFTTGKPFAFGVSLHDLEIYTTDLNWVKCYMTEQASRVYKIANLDCLSVYMNCNAKLFAAESADLYADIFRENIASKELLPTRYNYILGPISSIAKLQLNMNPEYDDPPFKIPKIDLSLDMEKLNIGLTSSQFQDILKLGDAMNRLKLGAPYRKYRPFNLPYKSNYKQWWNFAINAVQEDIRKRNSSWTWEHIKEHRELCQAYAQKHKEKELSKKPTATLQEACTLLETKLDLFNLVLIRQRVQIEVEKIKAEEIQTVKAGGWFGGWFGRGKTDDNAEAGNIVKQFEAAMTPDEKAKLYKAIGYQENAVPLDLPEDYEAINMNFTLFALEIGLYDDRKEQANESRISYDYHDLQTIMLLNFSMAKCSIQQRPAANGLCVNAGMQEMRLTGLKRDDFTPTLIESKFTHELNLLDILFEMNPVDKLCDQRIKIRARPLHVVYDSETIMRLMSVFSPPKTVNLSELEGAATAQMANFKERSATGMQYMIEKRTILDVDIQFMPNILIIPETGRYESGKQSLIVISLGHLNIRAKPRKSFGNDIESMFGDGHDQSLILKNIMEKAYDNYKVSIDDIQILVSRGNEPWNDILQYAQISEMHVLRPTSIIVEAGLCVVDDDPRLPKTKINILLPSIDVNITEERMFEALHVLTSLPLPEGENDVVGPLKKSISSMSIKRSLPNLLRQERKGKKAQAETALVEEIVQYTNLELNFALKEIKVVLYKASGLDFSRDSSESTKFGTPVEDDVITKNEEEFVDTQSQVVTAPEASETSSALIEAAQEKIVLLQVLQLEAYVAQRTYETIATAKLGAVNLTQYDYFEGILQELSVIDTPRFSQELHYLLTVSYQMADKKSPEFTTKYNSTEQLINVHFSTLNVTLHQECLLHLLAVADSLQRKLDSVTQKSGPKDRIASAADESIVGKLAVILEEEHAEETAALATTQETQRRSTRSTKVVDSIKIHVVANLEQFAVLLTCRKRPLAMLQVQHFNAGVIMKSSYTELNLRLKDILVNDMNPKNIHTNILSIVGQDALNCQIVMYNLKETSDYNANDMQINVDIGCMKIVFLNWFVTSVLKFVSNFQAAQQALANASAAAADVAMQNAMDAYEKATRMKLNIKIKAPVIVVPVDSQSFNALVLDLGLLMISNTTNEIRVPGNAHSPAVIDDIKLEMNDMKLSKASILDDAGEEGGILFDRTLDTIDLAYGLKSNINILDPISCALNVKRNLSSSWYKEVPELDLSGRLQSIELNIFMEDYGLIMSILNRNLNEGVNEFPSPDEDDNKPQLQRKQSDIIVKKSDHDSPSRAKTIISRKSATIVSQSKQKIHEQMKFNFQFDGVVANFMSGPNEGLARFAIYFLSVKGCKLVDGTLSTSVVLCNIQIEDTRRNTKSKITQYLCRKDWNKRLSLKNPTKLADECHSDVGYMLDLTAIIKENDTFAEIRVSGFDMILCIDFLLKLADFCTIPEDDTPLEGFEQKPPTQTKNVEQAPKAITSSRPASAAANLPKVNDEKKMNLILRVDEPDIILVESLEDINTNAIVFNAEAQLNYRTLGQKQIINGQIDGLKMFMCSFMPERREATKHYIIHPCVISLQGSTPENEGLHISLKLSEIIINVSPATIELFNKAMLTISTNTAEKTDALKLEANYSNIWNSQKFKDKDYWFVKVDEADDALEFLSSDDELLLAQLKTEKCVIEIPCITLVVESGVGYYTTPLISLDTRINAVISDWSRELGINGSLTLSVNYYNESLAVWEPIVETNEHTKRYGVLEYLPWELNFNMSVETKISEFDENVDEKTTKIKIHSEENLEVTISKTFLNLLGDLSDAFSQAIDAKGLVKPEVIAPYVVENDTGFDITIHFRRGIFTLHQCHMPNTSTPNSLNHSLIFQADQMDTGLMPDQVKDCKISPGGRAYLQTKDLSRLTSDEDEEYNIYVMIGDINKEVCLPVSKSDKRYFTLTRGTNQDAWGIVSEVLSEFGTTKINIHGVLNVHNHFTTSVKIYRNNPKSQEKIFVGDVAPGKVFHIPLHAIYADQKELYFALTDYNVSVQGIRWNDCPTDLSYSRQLQCDPIDTFEPLYINAIRAKKEIFFENTNKFKLLSVFYTIHLRPPLYLRNALPINVKVSVAGCTVHQNGKKAIAVSSDSNETDQSNSTLAKEDLLDYGEKEVMPGDCLHLPTVKLSGRTTETKSYLVVRLIQYLEKDWSCTTEIQEDNEIVAATWKFSAYDSAAKMDMDLLARYENRDGSIMVTLYSPFWMINKTGLMLSYKTDTETVDVLYHPPEYDGPILFSFREKFFFDKKSASIRVDNGEWSDKIPLDVAGSTGAVTCKANDLSYQIGVHNHLTHNSLTKQITFIPFYIATNKCEFPIELQEQSRPADPWIKIEPNSCMPMWPKNDSDHMIVAKVQGQRTAPFKYSEELCTLLQLNANKYGGINVDIQTTEGGIYINFTEYNPGDAPGLLLNHTSHPLVYYEKGSSKEHILQPHHRILYTWADATGDKCIIFGQNKVENDLRRDGVGELIQQDGSKAYWVSFLDGLQRILLFTEVEEIASKSESSAALQTITQSVEVRIHGIGLSVVDNEIGIDIMYLGITSSGIIWESKKENKNRYKQMNIHDTAQIEAQYQQYLINKSLNHEHTYFIDNKQQIDFDRMILNKNGLRTIQRTFLPGVWISMKTSPFQTQLHAKINKIQLDNQLIDPIFPVVLAPIAPPKSVATTTAMKPFIECSVVQRVVPNSNVKQFKYASMLMQEFHFKVDLLFLTAIANMFAGKVSDEQAAKLFNDNVESITKPLSDLVETHSMQEQKNFYDNLHLGPLKIHVSFSMAGSDTTALPGILSTLVQGVGVTLTDVNDVVFRLAFFEREYRFFTQQQLTSEITAHYTGQALKQLYVLVLGLDVLGNPYGLVVGLKKGVEDLFYEPFQGAIQGPGEFAEGLVLGVKSLFGHTVGGAAGAVSKITGAMGKGLAALTFDDDYQRKRRQAMNKKPKNFQEGIARSSKGLVMGFVDGVTGVVTKPVAGAREEGFEGFFKGLGKGAIGLVARPTAGVVDFASGSFDAVKRAAESNEDVVNLRPARFLHQDSVLRPYNRAEARGNKLLKEIEKGKFASTDTFIHCEEVVQKHEFLLVSNHRVIYVTKNDVFRSWAVQWTYLWHDIASIVSTDRGVEITLKKEGKRVLGLFSSHEAQKRLIFLHDKSRRDRLTEIMESQRREN